MRMKLDLYARNLTPEEVLSKVSEHDIYKYYIGYNFKIGEKFKSPLRKDRTPSFGTFIGRNGRLMYKDLASGDSGDVFKFVKTYLNLRYYSDVYEQIYKDLCKGVPSRQVPKVGTLIESKTKVISVKRRNYTQNDYDYWNRFKVIDRKKLDKFQVNPIERYWVDDDLTFPKYEKENPMYSYKIYSSFQIYRPKESKENKFRNNLGTYELLGLEQLPEEGGDLLIITKSYKDVMVLDGLGYYAVAPIGENRPIPKKVMDYLQKRWKKIVIFFDNDHSGIEGAKKIADKYNLETIMLPKTTNQKDISDYLDAEKGNKTVEEAGKLMEEILDEKRNEDGEIHDTSSSTS